ncbi:MAG: phosphoheptose isomerase [Bacteroidetes bacterium]|nr:phosphoheptose isomerase [Bacteroidota bacterium]
MELNFTATAPKESVFENVAAYLAQNNLKIATQDNSRPWGGFFVIDESEAEKFIALYFPHLTKAELSISGKLSPKILIVAPEKRLSWQYHHRRAEIWKLIGGVAGVVTSDTDEEKEIKHLSLGDIIQLKQGERHRLLGTDGWGIVAEIWRHTDANNPSDESDIVRVQDDFGR